jgi:ABC-type transport system involved in multi-copper enzyme maturation permease subunit
MSYKEKNQAAAAESDSDSTPLSLRPPAGLIGTVLGCRLGLKKTLRSRLLWGCLFLLALPLIAQLIIVATGRNLGPGEGKTFFSGWLTLLLPLAAILASYAGVAEEVESQTITYLYSRPLKRWSLPAGKLLAAVLLFGPAALILLALGAHLSPAGAPPLSGLLPAAVLATLVYSALALCAGALVPRHAVLASLGLLALLDMGLTHVPGITQTLTPSFHLKNLAGLLPPPGKLARFIPRPAVSGSTSVLVLLIQTALFSTITVIRSTVWEYRSSR